MSNAELPPHSRVGTRVLDGRLGTVGASRDLARRFPESGRPSLTPTAVDVLIAVGEPVSNAVRHAPGRCTLRMTNHGDGP